MPRFPFFFGEGLKRAVDHSHKAKLLNLDRVQLLVYEAEIGFHCKISHLL